MRKQLAAISALIVTNGFLQIGHSALAALMIQQGGRLGFSVIVLGLLTTATYVGMIIGNTLQRRLLPRISFIRTFSVCAAMATLLSMLLPILPEAGMWLLVRVFYGMFFSVGAVVCMDWVNAKANSDNRNRLMGVFMTVSYIAYGIGQYILLLGENYPNKAFILATAFLVLSLVPVCLTRFTEPQAPSRMESSSISFRDAYQIAPVSFLGQFAFGMATGASFLFIAYLEEIKMPPEWAATMAMTLYGSGFVLQLPIGWVSDKLSDRRGLMAVVAGISAVIAAFLFFGTALPAGVFLLLIFLFGAVSNPLFSLNIGYGQDFVERGKSADYSFRLFQSYAMGSLIGPPIAGFLMSAIAPSALFAFLSMIFTTIAIITATSRLMPRYRPAHTMQFRSLSPLMATQAISEEVMYSELDIGPDLPSTSVKEDLTMMGPEVPDQTTENIAVGPALPDPPTAEK